MKSRSASRNDLRRGRLALAGAAALAGVLPFLAGCAGYRLGPTNGEHAGARTIMVAPFVNQTLEPRLIEPVTLALRKRLQQDGTYRLASNSDADILVTGKILQYDRSEVSFDPRDTLTPRDYTVRIRAHITAKDRVSGRVLVDSAVAGRSQLRVTSDLTSADRQAVPLIAEDLARNATDLIVDGKW